MVRDKDNGRIKIRIGVRVSLMLNEHGFVDLIRFLVAPQNGGPSEWQTQTAPKTNAKWRAMEIYYKNTKLFTTKFSSCADRLSKNADRIRNYVSIILCMCRLQKDYLKGTLVELEM